MTTDNFVFEKEQAEIVLKKTRRSKHVRKYPNQDDARIKDGLVFPGLQPSFTLRRGSKVFTIGSCFARNIEEALDGLSGKGLAR